MERSRSNYQKVGQFWAFYMRKGWLEKNDLFDRVRRDLTIVYTMYIL